MTIRDLDRILPYYVQVSIVDPYNGETLFFGYLEDLIGTLWYRKVSYILPLDCNWFKIVLSRSENQCYADKRF